LEAFASFYGADFYGLPRNAGTLTLVRQPAGPAPAIRAQEQEFVPLAADCRWSLEQTGAAASAPEH